MIFLYDILLPKPPFPAETDVRACTPFQLGGVGGKKFRKVFVRGVRNFYFGGGILLGGFSLLIL